MIQRRKPIARSTKPLKRTPLKRVSKKRAKENREYGKRAGVWKMMHPQCAVKKEGCTTWTQDIHHVFGRGKYLLIEHTWLPVCRSCHNWIHEHTGQARTLNLLK